MDKLKRKYLAWKKNNDQKVKDDFLCEVWEVYHSKLQVYISRFSGRNRDVSDFASEILLSAFESIHQYRGEYSFSTWLYTLARNKIIDQIRRNEVETYDLNECEESHSDSPENLFIVKTERQKIRTAIEMLSSDDQEMIYLHYYEGLKYREISEITGVPEGTIKYRMHKTKKILKTNLERSL